MVVCCLDRDQDQITPADLTGALVNLRAGKMKIFLFPADADPAALDFIETGSDEKMNIVSANSQLAAVEASDRTSSDNRDLH